MPSDDNNPKHAPPASREVDGRTDPTVRARRAAMNRPDDGEAFIPDPSRRGAHVTANDAEFLAEEFLASATTGEPVHSDALDEVVDEEEGGPFLELDPEAEAPEATGDEVSVPRPRNARRSALPR